MSGISNEYMVHYPQEIFWEDIAWCNGIGYARIKNHLDYIITTEGDVISLKREEPRYVKQWRTNHGHLYVDLNDKGIRDRQYVHRLIAEAFLPNPENYPVVRHLDDNPENNTLDNLAWGTFADNTADIIRHGNDYKKGVYCFELDKHFRTCRQAARYFDVNPASITFCCQGKIGNVKGHHLCYEDEIDLRRDDPEWFKNRVFKPVIAISPEGKRTWYESRKAAGEAIGMPNCEISNVLSGHSPHSHGWRFEEAT